MNDDTLNFPETTETSETSCCFLPTGPFLLMDGRQASDGWKARF